ncbi:MAG: hypothetical protein GY940_23580 [bacterium]|nr:hypothetical protein [bacterium]
MNQKKLFLLLCTLCVLCGSVFPQNDPLPLSNIRYWAYQIQNLDTPGNIQKIVNSQYDMVVIDPTVTYEIDFDAADMVSQIKASKASDGIHRKLVIAYIDIGQAEEWRWYWHGHTTYEEQGKCKNSHVQAIQTWAPWVVACDPDGWAGNYPVAFWDPEWKDIVINGTTLGSGLNPHFNSMLDEVVKDGFDGVYLDWVEAWEMTEVQTRAQNEGKDPGQEMLNFIKAIRAYGKQYNPDFIVIQQNSSELIDEVGANALTGAVDAIAQEGVWWDGSGGNDDWNDPTGYDEASCCTNYYLTRLRKYIAAGFPVFVCDYALNKAGQVYQKTAAEGFIGYASRRSLGKLTSTPPTFATVNSPSIGTDKTQLSFTGTVNGPSPANQTFTVSNSGTGTLNWSITDDASWLTLTPLSGTNTGEVTVSVDITGLVAGTYIAATTVSAAGAANNPQTVSVTLIVDSGSQPPPPPPESDPFGSFDSPVDGSTVRGSVAVTGWALDDSGIDNVKIYRQTNGNGNLVYIGDALLVEGARPDVQQAYPGYPNNNKAGWGYMLLTNFLPNSGNGTFVLQAIAMDSEGNTTTLGSKTITCDNANAAKPFGAIDTPTQGGNASGGNFVNWGWALTPQPNSIPIDGSTIDVWVNGVNLGHPTYNINRSDIATLFPGYANSAGAVGYFYLDTTAYSNGVHTIQWTVSDSDGNSDGIGSRYFNVQNSNRRKESGKQGSGEQGAGFEGKEVSINKPDTGPVAVKRGYGKDEPLRIVDPGNDDTTIIIKPLERVEVHFFPWKGNGNVINLSPLPIGSTLDMEKGVFYWQPGPGFWGLYEFTFSVNREEHVTMKKVIRIKIL